MDFLTLASEVGFPIAGALAAGYFVFLTLSFILAGVTDSVKTLKGIIGSLDNRVQTMNNDLVKIDALLSYALGVKPNIDRIAANEGKEMLDVIKITLNGKEFEVEANSVSQGIKLIREQQESNKLGFSDVQEMKWAKANGFADKAAWWAAEQLKG